MNYDLNSLGDKANADSKANKKSMRQGDFKKLLPLVKEERLFIFLAFAALIVNSICSLLGPYLTGTAIDHFVTHGLRDGLIQYSLILLGVYVLAFVGNFLQIRIMGGVSQRLLFKLRNLIFKKIEELPLAFFSQNKAGDLISRINNDTEKLSQFFSETLTRFVGSLFMIGGAGIFLVIIHLKLGIATLLPAAILYLSTRFLSSWIKQANDAGLKASGLLSAEVQESLQNFKVIVAFNRRDYFRNRFSEINTENYKANIKSGIANGIYTPAYDFAANVAQYAVLVYGLFLIASGNVTIGILVSFLSYAEKFYNPLRQMAMLWAGVQVALAAWSRISNILNLESNMKVVSSEHASLSLEGNPNDLLEFKDVSFHYTDSTGTIIKNVLEHVSFELERGKTYALVGPTGGGKTTTASLMARLYDPTHGAVFLKGKDIRTYTMDEKTKSIGFILQDPIVFPGTLKDNIAYGNPEHEVLTSEGLLMILKEQGLDHLLERFEVGLDTPLPRNTDSMSLGQKQILAFVRAVLRKPDLLILDEATANIDTVTEQILERILEKLPKETTKVIIAHRLNTIQNADVIYFVNSSTVTRAGSIDDAVNMLLKGKKNS